MKSRRRGARLTLIVVPDESATAPVRRLQISRGLVHHGLWTASVALLLGVTLGALVAADYVRLRREAVDVEKLRSEATRHEGELAGLASSVTGLEGEFERLRAFERKVRVMADLPTALVEVRGPEAAEGGSRGEGAPTGGGGEGGPEAEGPEDAAVEAAPPADVSAGVPDPAAPRVLDAGAMARIQFRAERLAADAGMRAASLEELLEQLRGKARRLAATPSIWPTDGWQTSGYGYRRSPFTGRRKFHAGVDIAADAGTPVVASANGKVSFAGVKGSLGRAVVVDHGQGIRTSYGHLQRIRVKPGQQVERGDTLGTVGSTGRSTGPHLHYAVSVHGRSVNPANYMLD
jgi:murein DD-endopeptidase MepM/ murein hydrolase activator NlpD